jgi:DNA invertase Pin-like site-specific DNA recombinase
MAVFQYSRVSTDEQTVENQKLAAKNAGYAVDYFYADEAISGSTKADSRKQWTEMIGKMQKGDILVVSEISRIGRNTVDVLTNIDKFEDMGVKVCVLSYGNLDLTSDMGRVIITMAAAFAQLELSDLKRRTKVGMARAKASGIKLGAPMKISPDVFKEILKDKKEGASYEALEEKYGFHKNTIRNAYLKWGEDLEGYSQEYAQKQAQHEMRKTA